MAINIKNARAERLARELSAETGESLTDTVIRAIEDRLVQVRRRKEARTDRAEIDRILRGYRLLPVIDPRTPEEIADDLYDEDGLPR